MQKASAVQTLLLGIPILTCRSLQSHCTAIPIEIMRAGWEAIADGGCDVSAK